MSEDNKHRTAHLFRVLGAGPRGGIAFRIFSEDAKHRFSRRFRQQAIDAMMHAWPFTHLVTYKGTCRLAEMAATMTHIEIERREEREKLAAKAKDAHDPAEPKSAT